jgi:hypothetical protein
VKKDHRVSIEDDDLAGHDATAPAARPIRSAQPPQERRGYPVPAATVGLMTAARALGISPDDAVDLAKRGEFPCNVIETGDGHRVSFAALLRVLESGPVCDAGQDASA